MNKQKQLEVGQVVHGQLRKLCELKIQIEKGLLTIQGDTSRIAKNLNDLTGNSNLELNDQIRLLSQVSQNFDKSLAEVQNGLDEAIIEGARLATQFPERALPEKEGANPDSKEQLSPAEAAQIRHDEPITLKGILRSLLMANEPAQRADHR